MFAFTVQIAKLTLQGSKYEQIKADLHVDKDFCIVYLGFCPSMTEQWYKLLWRVGLSKAFAGQSFLFPICKVEKSPPVTAAVEDIFISFR